MTKTILHHCFCTNQNFFLYKLELNYTSDQYIHTNTKLFTQQEFLQVPYLNLHSRKREQCVYHGQFGSHCSHQFKSGIHKPSHRFVSFSTTP
jgi:hypothetical protein